MTRILAYSLVLFALLLTSCMDPEPSEVSVIATMGGQPKQTGVQVYTMDGRQLQEVFTQGAAAQVYIRSLAPGNYRLRFIDHNHTSYPAVRDINVGAGDSVIVEVDLSDASQNPEDSALPSTP